MKRMFLTDTVELKKCMVERNINTTTELSYLSGVNRNTLGKILRGTIQPTTYVMDKLISVLNISQEKAGKIFFAPYLRYTKDKEINMLNN